VVQVESLLLKVHLEADHRTQNILSNTRLFLPSINHFFKLTLTGRYELLGTIVTVHTLA